MSSGRKKMHNAGHHNILSSCLISAIAPFFVLDARAEDASETADAIFLEAVYTADVLSNVRGGIETGTRYLDNLDVTLTIDAEQALGWQGATIFIYGLYNNGTRFSETLVGDLHVASNIETGVAAVRLYEAWIDQRFWNDRASLRAGLYDLNSEFDAIEPAALFINSAHGIGTDFAQAGENGPSIFPYTSLALRLETQLSDHWLVRAAVLDGVPGDPDHPKRTAIKLGNGDGALLVGEINYAQRGFRAGLGAWRYTARFTDVITGTERRGNDGFYGFISAQLYAEPEDDGQGLSLFARLGRASRAFNDVGTYFGAGAVYRGLLPARPEDEWGIAIAWAETGAPFRQTTGGDKREVNVEMTYRAPLHDLITVQPVMQYIFNPGADPVLKNALVLGIRFELAWGVGS
jgi:porin